MTYFCSGHQGGSHDCAGDQSAIHEGRCQPAAEGRLLKDRRRGQRVPKLWFIHGLRVQLDARPLRARPGRRSASRLRFDGNSCRVHLENVQLRLGPGYCERSLCPQGASLARSYQFTRKLDEVGVNGQIRLDRRKIILVRWLVGHRRPLPAIFGWRRKGVRRGWLAHRDRAQGAQYVIRFPVEARTFAFPCIERGGHGRLSGHEGGNRALQQELHWSHGLRLFGFQQVWPGGGALRVWRGGIDGRLSSGSLYLAKTGGSGIARGYAGNCLGITAAGCRLPSRGHDRLRCGGAAALVRGNAPIHFLLPGDCRNGQTYRRTQGFRVPSQKSSGRFPAFGPAIQVLQTRHSRAWRTLLSIEKEGCAEKYTGLPRIAGSGRGENQSNFLPDARAARRVPDTRQPVLLC